MTTPPPTKSIRQLIASIKVSSEKLGRQTHAGVAMVVAAALDRVLQETLTSKMVKLNREMRDKLFGDFGTLRDFSGKINLAFAVGLADRETHERLSMVRKVRNLFAHTNGYLSFDSQEVRDLIAKESTTQAPTTIEDFIAVAQAIEVSLTQAAGLPYSGVIGQLDADR